MTSPTAPAYLRLLLAAATMKGGTAYVRSNRFANVSDSSHTPTDRCSAMDICFWTSSDIHIQIQKREQQQVTAALNGSAAHNRPCPLPKSQAVQAAERMKKQQQQQQQQTFKVWQPQRAARSNRPNTPSDGSKHNGFQTTSQAVLIPKHVSRQNNRACP